MLWIDCEIANVNFCPVVIDRRAMCTQTIGKISHQSTLHFDWCIIEIDLKIVIHSQAENIYRNSEACETFCFESS